MYNIDEKLNYKKTKNILKDVCNIIDSAKINAYNAINYSLVCRNWLLGKRIYEEELNGKDRASYGNTVIKNLSKELTKIYGKGFDRSNLYRFLKFYEYFPEIVDTVSRQSLKLLSWTHYRILLQVHDNVARKWYESEAYKETWGVRTLQRNISSQYYYRILKSNSKELVHKEMKMLSSNNNQYEFIKNPIITEFLGLEYSNNFTETELEKSIINNIEKFLIELGKGYAFVSRQEHIKTEKEDYFIDLVFYNYILKCFVLIDLKTSKITHQDVGQMDMYIRMYDELKRNKDDNPTIGILLCSDTDEDIARFSVLNDSNQLFASKYMLYLPTKEQLKKEIERQKDMFKLRKNNRL